MDNSPTTDSVKTTVAEKERLAKSGLVFNCKNPTFRKMFPEYVQKYEEQQLSNQPVPEQVSPNPRPLERSGNSKNRVKQSFANWMLSLLVSIFGVVMALPLLQL
ncbi:ubiquitin-conjugating enzyme 33 [Actinidia rufa]|uniref:Ubiquitin-conjugating enzyme 33 n=1 Tax=Actinidia rufa TaxID=165716 RepID=A0A7J0G093_9ERIC|nr:ubiquitin-conjugating enzyme 33 [Actinidia rufa]